MKMNKKAAVIAGVCAAVLAVGTGAYIMNKGDKSPSEPNTKVEYNGNKENNTEPNTGTLAPGDKVEVEVPTANPEAGVYEIKTTPSEEKADQNLYDKLAPLNHAVKDYYSQYKKDMLCVYGMMYSESKGFTVNASDVGSTMGVTLDSNIDDFADVLLIRPYDLANMGIEVKNPKDKSLKAFTGYNSADGYVVSAYNEVGGTLTKEQYKSLLGTYSTDHGKIRNLTETQEGYDDIFYATASAMGTRAIDIKHMACDDKYAVVVAGGLEDPTVIKEYVLVFNGNVWSVELENLEEEASPRVAVNKSFPDMDLGLLPKYIISKFGKIESGFLSFEQSLIQLGMLTEEDMPESYSCGVGSFAYMEMSSGKKLIGIVDKQNQLAFYEVKSTEEALAYMLREQDTPPAFILKYN